MITAVDANVLIDIGLGEPERATAAARLVEDCAAEGELVICDVAMAEIVPTIGNSQEPSEWVRRLGITYDPVGEEAAIRAGRLQAAYVRRVGAVRRIVPDFLIGAHALVQADRLLTRDRGFYRDYFKELRLVEPK